MTDPSDQTEFLTAPAADVARVLASCRERVLEREGIPMFLALHDERPGRALVVHDNLASFEGKQLAHLFDYYHLRIDEARVAEEPGVPEPTGAARLIDVLVVLSDQHLLARTTESP